MISRGKRDILRNEYQTQVNRWCKALGIEPPLVKVRGRVTARYSMGRRTISAPAGCNVAALVHETAHHLATTIAGRHVGHGALFRVALVTVAGLAMGRPDRYPWATEYATVKRWAARHGLFTP
jgi:hypothetical protein